MIRYLTTQILYDEIFLIRRGEVCGTEKTKTKKNDEIFLYIYMFKVLICFGSTMSLHQE